MWGRTVSKDPVFELCDVVRQTADAIHCYLGPGFLERIYENALVHRLRKLGVHIVPQRPFTVYDEDGAIIGQHDADIDVEDQLLVELKAVRSLEDRYVAQILGYMRASNREHALLINFGQTRFQIKKYVMSNDYRRGQAD